MIKLNFLGTGTSSGVPVLGCTCRVCLSEDPRDQRLRCAALLEINNSKILIDSGPDIRQQFIRHFIQQIDAILITHHHYDHIIGLDELRPFSITKQIQLYAEDYTAQHIKNTFPYIFDHQASIQVGGGLTSINITEITPLHEFYVKNIPILPLRVMHGRLPILGYKIQNLAYLTDVKTLPIETIQQIKGIDTLVISCLRKKEHSTHLNLDEALALCEQIQAKKVYFIHMNHNVYHQEWENLLPSHIQLAYDGLEIIIE